MARVELTQTAIQQIAADPNIQNWRKEKSDLKVPILGYYQRSYLTASDGAVTEFGDGFMLTFDRRNLDWAEQGLEDVMISIGNGIDVLVVAPKSVFGDGLKIDWNKKKYTFGITA